VNNDVVVSPDALVAFAAAAEEHSHAGVLAGQVYYYDQPDTVWYAGARFSALTGYSSVRGLGHRDARRYRKSRLTGRATGAWMAMSRTAIERVGLLDEQVFWYLEDVDWCLRARRAGLAVLFVPDASAWHKVSASTGGERSSLHTIYYVVRNTIVVAEKHRPLGRFATLARRAFLVSLFGGHVLMRRRPRASALRTVWSGFSDAIGDRLGPWDRVPS
jgi:GT2 family glycosyltransferase